MPSAVPVHRLELDPAELGRVDAIIEAALAEDLGSGDVTSRATLPATATARAEIVAKADIVFCGGPVAARVFALLDPGLHVELVAAEGERLAPKQLAMRIEGPARAMLAAERTALNLLQRMSGIATKTAAYAAAAGPKLRVTDTRKTMPGLRVLDRYAIRAGGGHNHRNDLGSAVLIKENHVRVAGGVEAAVRAAKAHAPHTMRVECEVTSLAELDVAIEAGADVVMLDNFDDADLATAVERAAGRVVLEASGNVTIERLPAIAASGVDVASVGGLTHSVPAADLSMLVRVEAAGA